MKILMVAAEAREFAGVVKHAREVRPEPAGGVQWARRAQLGPHEVLLAANGAGRERAAAAFDGACRVFEPEAVVSTGFCGALAPELEIGTVVVGTEVADGAEHFPARSVIGKRSSVSGTVWTSGRVAGSAAEKRELAATGACAVEMEAAGVAERARKRAIPFYCVRAVTDAASENLSIDYNAALRADGHFDTIIILKSALRNPSARFLELLRLRGRCVRAARALGDFFADCRF